jgi:hypothetical protein
VAGLLGGGRDHVEADEGEEHDRRPEADAEQPVGERLDPEQDLDEGDPVSTALAAWGASPAGGMNGFQLAVLILIAPAATNSRTTASLMATMTALKRELSFTPTMAIAVRTSTIAPATRLTDPSPEIDSGTGSTEDRYWAQPTDTAAAPRVNSSTRSQPMIQAISSPREAYEKV